MTESKLLGVLFDQTRLAVNKFTEVFEQNMIGIEKRFHSLEVADRPESTPEQYPIETGQNVINGISMAMNELFHGVLLYTVCWDSQIYHENAWNIKHFLYNPWFNLGFALVAASPRCDHSGYLYFHSSLKDYGRSKVTVFRWVKRDKRRSRKVEKSKSQKVRKKGDRRRKAVGRWQKAVSKK